MRRAVPLLVGLAALLAPGAVAADLHSRTLATGLRVIVKEDRRAPSRISRGTRRPSGS